jgi:hypothetical protein
VPISSTAWPLTATSSMSPCPGKELSLVAQMQRRSWEQCFHYWFGYFGCFTQLGTIQIHPNAPCWSLWRKPDVVGASWSVGDSLVSCVRFAVNLRRFPTTCPCKWLPSAGERAALVIRISRVWYMSHFGGVHEPKKHWDKQ